MNRALATKFWMFDTPNSDDNDLISNDEISHYLKLSESFENSWNAAWQFREFFNLGKNCDPPTSSEYVYYAANKFAELTNTDTKTFFKYTYILLFDNVKGPRLPTFIDLYGYDEFIVLLNRCMDDPLRIKEFYDVV